MRKAALVSFIADIKLTEDNQVKILELGPVFNAGFSGYEKITGQNPVENFVFPFYESFGLSVFRKGSFYNSSYKNDVIAHKGILPGSVMPIAFNQNQEFNPEKLSDHAAIIMRRAFNDIDEQQILREDPYNRFIMTSANNLANGCFDDKALFYAISKDIIPELLPEQKLYLTDKKGNLDGRQVMEDFNGHEFIVVKAPDQYVGRGINIIKVSANDESTPKIQNSYAKGNVCAVQELVNGKTVTIKGKDYDPAIRVLMTAWQDEGMVFVKCHDAYCKVPPAALEEERTESNTISKVKRGPGSAPVPEEDKKIIFSQLSHGLPKLFDRLFNEDAADIALNYLNSDDAALKKVGTNLAESQYYFAYPEGEEHYPKTVADKLLEVNDGVSAWIPSRLDTGKDPEKYKISKNPNRFDPLMGMGVIVALLVGLALFFKLIISFAYKTDENEISTLFQKRAEGDTELLSDREEYADNLYITELKSSDNTEKLERYLEAASKSHGYKLCSKKIGWRTEERELFDIFTNAALYPDENYMILETLRMGFNDDKEISYRSLYATNCPAKEPSLENL